MLTFDGFGLPRGLQLDLTRAEIQKASIKEAAERAKNAEALVGPDRTGDDVEAAITPGIDGELPGTAM